MRSTSKRYLPKERDTLSVIYVHSGDRNLLRDQEPIVCLNSICQVSIVCISVLNCVKIHSFAIINIINTRYLNSERYLLT